jgi:hypothetical protein
MKLLRRVGHLDVRKAFVLLAAVVGINCGGSYRERTSPWVTLRAPPPFDRLLVSEDEIVGGVDEQHGMADVISVKLFQGVDPSMTAEQIRRRLGEPTRWLKDPSKGVFLEYEAKEGVLRGGYQWSGSSVGTVYRWGVILAPRDASVESTFHRELAEHIDLKREHLRVGVSASDSTLSATVKAGRVVELVWRTESPRYLEDFDKIPAL